MRANGLLWIGSLALVALGVVLLLDNFLLLSGFNVAALAPLLLVVAGGVLLLRGDFVPGKAARTFGITRGSVENAILEVNAGEIDIQGRALSREERLIAGQFAINSRPTLTVQDTTAYLRMDRAATPWLSFATWDVALARDLPWTLYMSASLGQIDLDLTGIIVQRAAIATGLGDIQVIVPQEALEPLTLRSNIGDIRLLTPPGAHVRVTVRRTRTSRVHVDETRYEQHEPGVYLARSANTAQPVIDVSIHSLFGDVYLA